MELGTNSGGQKTRMMGYRDDKKFDDTISCVDIMHQGVRQMTDGHQATAKATLMHSVYRAITKLQE